MPSLHRRKGSRFLYAAYSDANGHPIKKSTKTGDKKLAWTLAVEWEKAAQAGREGRLVEGQCRRVISEIHEQATGSPIIFHTCRDWFTEWLAGKAGATSERTLEKYKQITGDFLKHLGQRADSPLNVISSRDVRSFRDALAKTGLAPVTVNQAVRKVLSVPFTAALRMGYVTVNPCAGVEALKDSVDTEKDVFTPDQLAALCAKAKGDWRGVILAGYFTGLRLSDITELRWESLDMDAGLLKVKTRKTGKTVVIPLAPDFAQWISSRPRGIGKAPVFPSMVGKRGTGRNGFSMQFKGIMTETGITGRVLRSGKGSGRNTSSLSFHSLRHSFNSALANAGVVQEVRQKLTGHASVAMNEIYTHHDIETLRTAMSSMPRLFRSQI